jgi:hypothetical protein
MKSVTNSEQVLVTSDSPLKGETVTNGIRTVVIARKLVRPCSVSFPGSLIWVDIHHGSVTPASPWDPTDCL